MKFNRKFFVCIALLVLISQSVFSQVGFVQEGMASYYADEFEGRTTASGERYSHKKATCAHMSIPFGALVKITNLENNISVIVRVNDRGPFAPDRIVDVSKSVAQKLGMDGKGIIRVSIEVVDNNGYSIQKTETIQQDTQKVDNFEKKEDKKTEKVLEKNSKTPENAGNNQENKTSETEIFTLNIKIAELKGFAVQVGSFKELVNVLRIASDIQSVTKSEPKIQVLTVNGEKIYRLMLGTFNERKEAELFKEKIAKIYKDCFIVELKD